MRGGFALTGGWRGASSLFLLGKAGYIYVYLSAVFALRVLSRFYKRLKNVSSEHDRLNA